MIVFILLSLVAGLGAADLEEHGGSTVRVRTQRSLQEKVAFSAQKNSAQALYQQDVTQLEAKGINPDFIRRQAIEPPRKIDAEFVLRAGFFAYALYSLYYFGVTDVVYVAALYAGVRSILF